MVPRRFPFFDKEGRPRNRVRSMMFGEFGALLQSRQRRQLNELTHQWNFLFAKIALLQSKHLLDTDDSFPSVVVAETIYVASPPPVATSSPH